MEKFWTCFVEGTNGGYAHKHSNYSDAHMEAERLANMPSNIGRKVHVLQAVGYCVVELTPLRWWSMA